MEKNENSSVSEKVAGKIASAKTIQANGGILENEIKDDVGLSKSGCIQRYWIELS